MTTEREAFEEWWKRKNIYGLDREEAHGHWIAARAPLLKEIEQLNAKVAMLREENAELKEKIFQLGTLYDEACRLVAKMHEAAVGYIGAPKLGVVEDVAELRAKIDAWEKQHIGYVYESDDYDKSIIRTDSKGYKKAIPVFTKPKEA